MAWIEADPERPGEFVIFDDEADEFVPMIPIMVRDRGKGA